MKNHAVSRSRVLWLAPLIAMPLASCKMASKYTKFLQFGDQDKKEALLDQVRESTLEQDEAMDEFTGAVNLFTLMTGPKPNEDLESLYDELQDEVEDCQKEADELTKRIDSIRLNALEMFAEWNAELDSYANPSMRAKSESMMRQTQMHSEQLLGAMERLESRMQPVLNALEDYVLFFNYNLNPRAISTLKDTYEGFRKDVFALRAEMESTRATADDFIASVEGQLVPMPAAQASSN